MYDFSKYEMRIILLLGVSIHCGFGDQVIQKNIHNHWTALRHTLEPVHQILAQHAGHSFSNLNVTASDVALHVINTTHSDLNPAHLDTVVFSPHALNITHPDPPIIPLKEIVNVTLFGSDTTLPALANSQVNVLSIEYF